MPNKKNKKEDLSDKIQIAPDRAIAKLKVEAKATGTYLVVADKKGNIKKIHPKDL